MNKENENHFKIIVCCYNTEDWISKTIRSIKHQQHKNFECFIVDAASTDNTLGEIKQTISKDSRFHIIENKERKPPLQNQFETLSSINVHDEDVIVNIDGDDWLYNSEALSIVNEEYSKNKNLLLTHGNFILYPHGNKSELESYPQNIIDNNDYRKYKWLASHLRTFKYKLFKNLKKEELLSSWDNKYYEKAGDLALMFPLLEMSGGNIKFISDILYVYNIDNPLNENKENINLINKVEMELRNKEKKKPIFRKFL